MPKRTCTVPGCGGAHVARGYCAMHWARFQRTGSTDLIERTHAYEKICVLDGCGGRQIARGWCHKHYKRWQDHGTPHGRTETTHNRRSFLLLDVLQQLPTDDCVHWTGVISRVGYGAASAKGQTTPAHRVVYEAVHGPIPPGLALDHLCHNQDLDCAGGTDCLHRRCVNPAHLEPVTPAENDRRARQRPNYVPPSRWRERTA